VLSSYSMQKVELTAQPRTIVGQASKQLRKQGLIPAVIYGHNFKALNIQVTEKDFKKAYSAAGETTLVYLKLESESYPTIIHDVASNSVSDAVMHVDFYKVRLDEKIKANIPVMITGEAPAIKAFQAIMVRNLNEIEVEGLPQDLPHQFDIDASVLANIGDQILVKDLKVPANIEIKAGADEIIVLMQAPISEEQLKADLETAPAVSADDVEVIKKEKKEDEVGDEAAPAESTEEKK
jgi:large subunit ribosomal protein L25